MPDLLPAGWTEVSPCNELRKQSSTSDALHLFVFQLIGSTVGDATKALSTFCLVDVSEQLRLILTWPSGNHTTAMGECIISGSPLL
jgi:hypothetical protein